MQLQGWDVLVRAAIACKELWRMASTSETVSKEGFRLQRMSQQQQWNFIFLQITEDLGPIQNGPVNKMSKSEPHPNTYNLCVHTYIQNMCLSGYANAYFFSETVDFNVYQLRKKDREMINRIIKRASPYTCILKDTGLVQSSSYRCIIALQWKSLEVLIPIRPLKRLRLQICRIVLRQTDTLWNYLYFSMAAVPYFHPYQEAQKLSQSSSRSRKRGFPIKQLVNVLSYDHT